MVCSLQRAFECGRYRQIHVLLQVGKSNINSTDVHGRTILMKCASIPNRQQGTELVRSLLRLGADKTILDNDGRNALFYAALSNRVSMARMLVSNLDVDLNAKDNTGKTVLHLCCEMGLYKLCKLLVPFYRKYGIPIDLTDGSGKTALHLACAGGFYDIARLLVYEGKASLNQRDDVEFKNAREWLAESLIIPLNIDPFPPMVDVRKKWANYAINCANISNSESKNKEENVCFNTSSPAKLQQENRQKRRHSAVPLTPTQCVIPQIRCQSAIQRKPKMAISDEMDTRAKTTIGNTKPKVEFKPLRTSTANENSKTLLKNRSRSAPPKTRVLESSVRPKYIDESTFEGSDVFTLKTTWLDDLNTQRSRAPSAEIRSRDSSQSFFSSGAFQEIYKLYTEQCSKSYRPNALAPVKPSLSVETNPESCKTERPDTGNTKTKFQRFIRMRRAESLIKQLKGFKRPKSPTSPRTETLAAVQYRKSAAKSEPNYLLSDRYRRRSEYRTTLRSVNSEDGISEESFIKEPMRSRYASVDVNMVGLHQS